MSSLSGLISGRHKVPFTRILDFTTLTQSQKYHLCRVYGILLSSVLLTALGVQFANLFITLPVFLTIIIQLVCIYKITVTSHQYSHGIYNLKNSEDVKRLSFFACLSFTTGLLIAPYLRYAYYIDPAIVPSAFFATVAIFLCFTVAALMSTDRRYLLLGGFLGSAMSYISLMIFGNIFFRSQGAHQLIVYSSLFVYMGYILYDTQLILYDISHRGQKDPLLHAFLFYGDIIGIFIKLLQIITEKKQKKKE